MSFESPDEQLPRVCEACEDSLAEIGRRCVTCEIQWAVDNHNDELAYAVAEEYGRPASEVATMIHVAEERCQQAFRDRQAKLLRLAMAANDNADMRPATPPPPASISPSVYIPRVTPPPTRFWDPERGTVRPGRA